MASWLTCWQVIEVMRKGVEAAVKAARREVDLENIARIPKVELEPLFWMLVPLPGMSNGPSSLQIQGR